MRNELKPLYGHKRIYMAQFVRFGTSENPHGPSMLLKNVMDHKGNIVADHVWLQKVPSDAGVNLLEGDFVEFTAIVHAYKKVDYGLTLVSEIKRV